MAKDPTAAAQRWAQNLGAATQAIQAGVAGVTVAPGAAAARQKSVWMQNTQASADKWARNVGSVPLSDWQNSMNTKGIPRIASGAQEAIPKMTNFLQAFIPHVEAGVRALPARGTLENNIARMVAMVRHNAQFTGRPAGR